MWRGRRPGLSVPNPSNNEQPVTPRSVCTQKVLLPFLFREKAAQGLGREKLIRLLCRPRALRASSGLQDLHRQEKEKPHKTAPSPTCPIYSLSSPNSGYLEAQRRRSRPALGRQAPGHSPLRCLLSQGPRRRRRRLNGCTCRTQSTASGAQLQQQMAPGDERHQPISAQTAGVAPPHLRPPFPTSSHLRCLWSEPLSCSHNGPLILCVQGWP